MKAAESPRVLLMDDSDLVVAVTCAALERAGFEVRVARSIGEFNRILTTWAPTLVLTDVNMPDFTGTDLCKWIRGRADTHTVPVVLFSHLPDEELERLALASGADAHFSKKGGLPRLVTMLRSLCEGIVW
jgi:CheY-like chemotaxis protein